MNSFKITDLLPRRASFKLSIPDKVYDLRPCTPRDLLELKDMGLDIEDIMKNPINIDVCKVILFLMEFDHAKDFKKTQLKTINIDTGEEEVEEVGGYKLLLKFVASLKEQLEMFLALLNSLGFEEEIVKETKDKIFNQEIVEEKVIKKKAKIRRKKKR